MRFLDILFLLLFAGILGGAYYIYPDNSKDLKKINLLEQSITKIKDELKKVKTELNSKEDSESVMTKLNAFTETNLKVVSKQIETSETFLLNKLIDMEEKVQKKEDELIKLKDELKKYCDSKCQIKKKVSVKKRIIKKKTMTKTPCSKSTTFKKCLDKYNTEWKSLCLISAKDKIVPKKISRKRHSNSYSINESTDIEEDILVTEINPKSKIKGIKPKFCSYTKNDFYNKCYKKICSK